MVFIYENICTYKYMYTFHIYKYVSINNVYTSYICIYREQESEQKTRERERDN